MLVELLRLELQQHRDLGASFDAAWEDACRAALRTVTGWERSNWKQALQATEPAWRSAYNHEADATVDRVAGLEATLVGSNG